MKREPAYYLSLYKKPILIGIASIALLIVIFSIGINIWLADRREGLIPVEVLTAPSDSRITLDTGEVIGNGIVYIKPGKYTAKIEKEGFYSYERDFQVSNTKDEKSTLYASLGAKSDEAKNWARWNQSAYGELERKTREIGVAYTKKLRDSHPIINDLPLKDPYFTVGYKASEKYGITITLKGTSPRYRQSAIQAIEAKGYNLGEYVVEYEGFDNPLEEGKNE